MPAEATCPVDGDVLDPEAGKILARLGRKVCYRAWFQAHSAQSPLGPRVEMSYDDAAGGSVWRAYDRCRQEYPVATFATAVDALGWLEAAINREM